MVDLRSASRGRPLIIGHRGASGEAPENTMASFRLAVEQGADILETDVHLSADGVPVVIHDHTLDRTTNGHGLVARHTLAQIQALDAGSWYSKEYAGERIPTLDDLIRWASGKTLLAIEIKLGPIYYPDIENKIVELLRRRDMVESAVIISFDHRSIRKLKHLCPEVACGVLFACTPVRASSLAIESRADALLPHWSNLTKEMVEEAHADNLAVAPWCVDDELEMKWVLSMGVDAVATNYPGRLASLLTK